MVVDFPGRGQQAPAFWDVILKQYIDEKAKAVADAAVLGIVINDLGTSDGQTAALIGTSGTATEGALADKIEEGVVEVGVQHFPQTARLAINVRDYGAVGNGATDDTTAIQAALNAAKAQRRALYLPQGRYKITATLTYAVTDATKWAGGLVIYGDGMGFAQDGSNSGSVIEPTNAVTGPAIDITGIANSDNSNKGQINGLAIENLGIRGVSGGTNGDGIRIKYFTNCVIRNVAVAYCSTAVRMLRQANDVTFGYANSISIDNLFAVANRGWGLNAADAGAMCGLSVRGSNFGSNALGGVKVAPGPATFTNNIYTGNGGPGCYVVAPTGTSNATGPTWLGEHFEFNGTVATGTYASDLANIVIDYAQGPRILGCNFLGSTLGEHSVKAGYVGSVSGLTMIGNTHFGKQSVATQRVLLPGPSLVRTNFQDTEAFGFSGVSTRALSSQLFAAGNYSHLAQDSIVQGGLTASTGAATVLFANADLPPGCRATFEISSQGGAVYAYGLVKRGRDGTSLTVVPLSQSSDCALSIVSNSLRVTQTNTSSLILWWSMHITQTTL